jgi:hypothetical protein
VFAEAITRAITAARTDELDHLAREVWRAHGAGVLDDATAQAAAEAIRARQVETRPKPRRAASGLPRGTARRPRTPDRQASIERRRRLAASGPMPPVLAARFTQGELAVLKVVADAVKHRGRCTMCMDEIAGRAGVCRRLAQMAIRLAEQLGLITVHERRLGYDRSDTNVITIISQEWRAWLRLTDKGGCKTIPPTQHRLEKGLSDEGRGVGAGDCEPKSACQTV